ncbi:hypothetical protein [Nannocystis pusilla]|uniref:hypothetical protein n=1 Tax=Nannocystis pusilla TaxID=889268 RepID=UPI003B7F33E6
MTEVGAREVDDHRVGVAELVGHCAGLVEVAPADSDRQVGVEATEELRGDRADEARAADDEDRCLLGRGHDKNSLRAAAGPPRFARDASLAP